MNENKLNFLLKEDIITEAFVQQQYEMAIRNKFLNMHPWSISQGKDGFWRTYLPDEEKKRKMVKKASRKELENVIITFYKKREEKSKIHTFDDCYWNWRKIQDVLVAENTISKYNTDYKRYFENTDFAKINIAELTADDIKVFLVTKVKELHLCNKACKTLFGYTHNTILRAKTLKLIPADIMEDLKSKDFYKYCVQKKKPLEKQIIPENDFLLLLKKFEMDYLTRPEYIPTYAVHLAALTGMRVGEISALTWVNVTQEYIIINQSEKCKRTPKGSPNEYFIDNTKNGKERIFPLIPEIRVLLNSVKKIEMKYGYLTEFVFSDKNGRIHAPLISSCLKNKCRQLGISERGIHAFRKTFNSKLRCSGVSSIEAASLLGHSKEVNENYYTFDVTSLQEKADMVSKVIKKA